MRDLKKIVNNLPRLQSLEHYMKWFAEIYCPSDYSQSVSGRIKADYSPKMLL